MMNGWRIALVALALSGIVPCAVVMCSAHEVSVACMMAYDEGGARAVVSTYECPRWELGLNRSPCEDTKANCNFATATIQGHRDYQEDRVVCNHAMKIPVLGKDELKELTIGIAAVFDGHAGAEASELASRKFLDYFYINVVFKNYKQAISNHKVNYEVTNLKSSRGSSSLMEGDTSLKSILNESLIKTFEDIDSEFTEDALKYGYKSGSTGTVALLANGQVLVGYVGDSKALLCSVSTRAAEHAKGTSSGAGFAEELTIDHHPDREDEKARIEASGGFVRTWGVPRVNGMLAMTRAFGDLSFKRFGVIAEPEVIGWRSLTGENTFLVLGTDGIFEGLTPSHVCAVLNENACTGKNRSTVNLSSCLGLPALANLIVNLAFENGSNDNISVVLVPLESDDSS